MFRKTILQEGQFISNGWEAQMPLYINHGMLEAHKPIKEQ